MSHANEASQPRMRWVPAGPSPGDDDPTIAVPPTGDDDPTISRDRMSAQEDDDEATREFEGRKPKLELYPELILDGRYRLIRRIGHGGMGEVWEARHVSLDRAVAIKFLTQEEGGPRFQREAQAIVAVDHDGVVDVLDFGATAEGVPYFAMELLHGYTLDKLIRRRGPLAWPEVRRIALELSDALAHAHGRGIIHRDLKPSNVFVLEPPPARGSSTKLIDFGIAKLLDANQPKLTKTGFVHGTPAYMSPEQILGEAIDGRADEYALGCLLYHMLTGRRPFEGLKGAEALYSQLYDMPPRFHEVAPGHPVPELIERLVFRMLAKQANDRFPDMAAVYAAIAALPVEFAPFLPAAPLPIYPSPPAPAPPPGASVPGSSMTLTSSSVAMSSGSLAMSSAGMSSASLSGSSMQAPTQKPTSKANVVGIVVGAIIFVAALALAAWVGLQLI